ncbi:MAG: hypothetical protein M1823_004919 [Watsoniomyces obsoletus]|nr:MAG: hypothetical protein M1823_004919 [Watsoniomyces obsoletus]
MSHLLPAVPQVLPGMHYQMGRRPNDPYMNPPPPMHPAHHPPPMPSYHMPHHPHAPHYPPPPPHHYRPYPPYQQHAPPPPPPAHQYPHGPHGPLVVSSYPHAAPHPAMMYQHPGPPPPPALAPQPRTPMPAGPPPMRRTPPSSNTSPTVATTPALTASASVSTVSQRVETPPSSGPREKFSPPLPWLSVPGEPFPPAAHQGRRKRRADRPATSPLELPEAPQRPRESLLVGPAPVALVVAAPAPMPVMVPSQASTVQTASEAETPATSQPPSEADSTHPTTPSSAMPVAPLPVTVTVAPKPAATHQHTKTASRTILPAVPAIPMKPDAKRPTTQKRPSVSRTPPPAVKPNEGPSKPVADAKTPTTTKPTTEEKEAPIVVAAARPVTPPTTDRSSPVSATTSTSAPATAPAPAPAPVKAAPRSWADLVKSNVPKTTSSASTATAKANSTSIDAASRGPTGSVAHALQSFEGGRAGAVHGAKMAFLEPRGLVNTGNMCYMNSILQVLLFCAPFYQFLEQIAKRSTHSFKDDTPLLDAFVLFLREFRVIDSAVSEEQLKLRLKEAELEQYGEAFIPDFVYEALRRLPRFASMRRGHQQDAEEFLGFLLEGLHNECVQVMSSNEKSDIGSSSVPPALSQISSPVSNPSQGLSSTDAGWLEVGPKQKAAVTRASGHITMQSPITKIFGGNLRSELRVPGLKNSVTLEPYQALPLDIQSPQVHNVIDALKGLTRPETLHGNFNSPRGPDVKATKQVFIENLPPVLILHLKRFQYDNQGGTQKIWKKIGYPLDLELPKEIFPPNKRGAQMLQGSRYRLISVVYHHGNSASGGHYTVDVRRQDGREWIRLDDTVIRRVRKEDVAEAGSEEDSKVTTTGTAQPKTDSKTTSNGTIYNQMGRSWADAVDDDGWHEVNGTQPKRGKSRSSRSSKSSRSTTPDAAKVMNGRHRRDWSREKDSIHDNRVAYLLFYQRMS